MNRKCDTKAALNADFNTFRTHYTYINTSTHESPVFVCESHKYFSVFPQTLHFPANPYQQKLVQFSQLPWQDIKMKCFLSAENATK